MIGSNVLPRLYDFSFVFGYLSMVESTIGRLMPALSEMSFADHVIGHTSNLSFLLHGQNFWRIKFTPKNANFSR